MLFFRSEEHVDRWCASWSLPKGAVLPLDVAWQLASIWLGPDRRDPGWRRFTLEETEAIFAQLGLTGSFWSFR
jgi:hypothetical protein